MRYNTPRRRFRIDRYDGRGKGVSALVCSGYVQIVLVAHLAPRIPGHAVPRDNSTPSQLFHDHPPHHLANLAILNGNVRFRDALEHAPIRVQSRTVDKQDDQDGEYIYTANYKDLLEFARLDRLVDSVHGANSEENQEEAEDDRVRGGVPDAKERNAGDAHYECRR